MCYAPPIFVIPGLTLPAGRQAGIQDSRDSSWIAAQGRNDNKKYFYSLSSVLRYAIRGNNDSPFCT